MTNTTATPTLNQTSRDLDRRAMRVATIAASAVALFASPMQSVGAQTLAPPSSKWEFRATSGALVGTGAQRSTVKDAQLSAAQISWLVRPSLAITGTFGWARSRDLSLVDSPKLDVFTSDLGIEARTSEWFANHAVTLSPFAGVGVGARSYNYRKLDVDATNNVAAYGSVGGEIGVGRVGLRIEARDYATGFKPLMGAGESATRNDVVIMAGVRFNRHK